MLIFWFSLFSLTLFAQERSETFIVRAHDKYFQVLAPKQFHQEQSVLIENKTLDRLIGKLVTEDRKHVRHVAIEPGKFTSLELPTKGQQKLVFIPLVPAFQEVELVIGKEAYEIPPKR